MAVPTLVQFHTAQFGLGNTLTQYNLPAPHPVLSGNAVIVFIQNSQGSSPSSVVDDMGNSYTLLVSNTGDPNQREHIYYRLNITNAPRIVTANWGSAVAWVSMSWCEYYNIATASAANGSSSNSGSGTALTAGSFSPADNNANGGNLILAFGVQTSDTATITSWTPGGSFEMLGADILDGAFTMAWVQTTAAAVNAACTISPTKAWGMVAGAFKAATAGTAPSGMTVLRTQHMRLKDPGPTIPAFTVIQFPCRSNHMLFVQWNGAGGLTITSITDTNSNAWVKAGNDIQNPGSGMNQVFYCANSTGSSTMKVTINHGTIASIDTCLIFHEVVGALNTLPYDTASDAATATGNDDGQPTVDGASLTPSTDGGLIFSYIGVSTHDVTDNTPSLFYGASTVPVVLTSPVDENQGPSCYKNTSTATLSNLYTFENGAHGNWADKMVAFIAQPPVTLDIMNPNTGAQGTSALAITCTGTRLTGV